MLMQFIIELDAGIIAPVPSKAQHPCRVLFIRRQSIEETVAVDYSGTELRMAHLLTQLLASWLIFAQEVNVPSHSALQWRQTFCQCQLRRVSCDWHSFAFAAHNDALP